ncbi:MAG: serine/threonine-protein kinase [Beijerinckiaceae bacterium]|nr:serine/threonine-protein kinase [Beijerinckiaceae bacterium]
MSASRMIGQYSVVERLAVGGAGEVLAAIDTKVGREVAIKFLRPELASDPEWTGRFLAEAKSLGRLNHPNIATLYTLFQDEDHLCMVMELVRGRTVEQIIEARGGPLGTRASLAILAQVADGLSYAHEEGVIHRDIKPSNLMVTESGRVKIMDFGIARVRGSERMTRAGSAVGTLLYMSPEQCRGLEGDERSDIYSLAAVLYEMLAGAPPFEGTSDFELQKAHISTPPPPLIPRVPGIEPQLESAVMTALSKRPEQRYPSIRSFSDAIGASALRGDATGIVHNYLLPGEGQETIKETASQPPFHTVALAIARSRAAAILRRFKELHPAVQGALAGTMAVAVLAAFLLWPESETGPEAPATSPGELVPEKKPEIAAAGKSYPEAGPFDRRFDNAASGSPAGPPARLNDQGRVFPALGKGPQSTPGRGPDTAGFQEFEQARNQQNFGQALEIAKKLEKEGEPAGAYALGLLYFRGEGVERDEHEAFLSFSKAAKGGYPMAQLKLGAMYYVGKGGVRPDAKLAAYWYEQAAKNGVGEAMYSLSGMCRRGQGGLKRSCEQDWLEKMRETGYEPER